MHVYVWEDIASLTTEPLNGCLRNLVGMKCSWPGTCVKMFWPYLPRGGSRARQNRSWGVPFFKKTSSSDRKATATNRIHSNDLERCVMNCCCFWFHSVVNYLPLNLAINRSAHCTQVSDQCPLGL